MSDKPTNQDNLQDIREKAEKIAETHGNKIAEGLEKAGDLIDEKTGGKHGEKIDTGVDKAQDFVRKLGDRNN
ncbi:MULTISPECIES: antitoxin [Protofrankia]|uniref:MT0933-like antitoxin protein n=1 Tax=Protofrankia coriariae TaxID=1562887 RepID=A0ABR5EZI3_9ACTN|nr:MULTISPECIES: antitoxin [Protofrankia]KLL09852.1 hypothetical protein FrCorBMG51_21985 [Protofrankia coriariae]ONH32683.1 hypothetical protein BL254_21340 [Protofrankia sp. BMG5.30]